jgi:hypothetical protein
MRRHLLMIMAALALCAGVTAPPASAAFGLQGLGVRFENEDGTLATQAGSHPFAMTTTVEVSTVTTPAGIVPEGAIRDLTVDQIPGFVGSQTAVPTCSQAAFNTLVAARPECPDSTVVGYIGAGVEFNAISPADAGQLFYVPVYNLAPPPGEPAELGFVVLNVPVTIDVKLNNSPPYNLVATLHNVSQALLFRSSTLILWGNPESPAHDSLRGNCLGNGAKAEPSLEPVSLGDCPVTAPERPFLTLPRACEGPLSTTFDATDWLGTTAVGEPADPQEATGCGSLPFAPSVSTGGTNPSAASSTGLDFEVSMPDQGLTENSGGLAQSDIKQIVATLPEGVTVNPSTAEGLGVCSPSQYEAESLDSSPEQGCPASSKVGVVQIQSPLVEEELKGSVYLAQQEQNPFHSLLALYLVIKNPRYGIFIKQAGKVEPNLNTGQLVSTFEDIPQLPFSHLSLIFREGPRAPLVTPSACGTYSTQTALTPRANPAGPITRTATFTVTSGAGGGSCPSGNGPFSPSLEAGTLSPVAGSYSPFVLRLRREPGSQQLKAIDATLPPGLIGKLAGVTECSDAQIAAASSRTAPLQGAIEQAGPSCPASSEVGTVTVGAGAGDLTFVKGHAYLAGPYEGAPLSLEIITPAIAGPIDLGVVAVRTALEIDPFSTQITAKSDPIPTLLHGLPLDVRTITVDMGRPNFTLNPTDCEPKSITGSAISTTGTVASLSQSFQATQCAGLKFKPKLNITLKGSTKRTGHPALKAVLTYPKGGAYANVARAQVNLPHSEFIEQSNLNKTCTKPVLLEGKCPKSTIYGKAKAWTPLLDKPLQGNVYLVGGFGFKLPALVAELDGQIRVLLAGKVDSGPNKGIRNTFEAVPDAPVEKFELNLKGGPKYSLLVNSENLCKKPQKAIARFTAQNGKVLQTKPVIANSCKKKSQGGGKKKKSGSGGKKHGKK